MKKWIIFFLLTLCPIIYADQNDDEFQRHANSWVFVQNHASNNSREYVNAVDGTRCFITDSATKKNLTSYDAFENKLDSLDFYYGTSENSKFLSIFPPGSNNALQQNKVSFSTGNASTNHQNTSIAQLFYIFHKLVTLKNILSIFF